MPHLGPARLLLILALATPLAGVLSAARAQEVESAPTPPVLVAPGQRPKQPPIPQGVVTGHITLADTRAPARGARVMLFAAEGTNNQGAVPSLGVTNLQGAYVIRNVPAGEYVVLALANGYLSPIDSLNFPTEVLNGSENKNAEKEMWKKLREAAPVVRVSGSQTAQADLALERGAALSGRVLYADGTPAGQLPVSLQNVAEDSAKSQDVANMGSILRTLALRQNPMTDDNGRFRIAGVPAGTYRIAVAQTFDNPVNLGEELMESMMAQMRPSRALVMYSGNTWHRKSAKTYEVHAGDTVADLEITLPLDGLHSVSGTAAGKDGTLLNSAGLELHDTADPAIVFHGQLRPDGTFQFSAVPEGTYELKASSGRIFGNAPSPQLSPEMLQGMSDQLGVQRAFADTTLPVVVQSADLLDLKLTLPDAPLPPRPKGPTPTSVQDEPTD